jgi:hypothetical protein
MEKDTEGFFHNVSIIHKGNYQAQLDVFLQS